MVALRSFPSLHEHRSAGSSCDEPVPGIIVSRACPNPAAPPRIEAFVWGGKTPPDPTLPYGRASRSPASR